MYKLPDTSFHRITSCIFLPISSVDIPRDGINSLIRIAFLLRDLDIPVKSDYVQYLITNYPLIHGIRITAIDGYTVHSFLAMNGTTLYEYKSELTYD